MKKLYFFSILILFALPGSIFSQQATIAAWNLGGFEPIPPLRVTNHVRAIKKMNPDVMILTEVNPDSVAGDIAAQLGSSYKSVILSQTANQNIAILYKDTACAVDVRLIDGSDDNNSSLRKALAAHVQIGKFDFYLIGVHLKSGRQTNNSSNPVPVRTRQARAVAEFITKAQTLGEKDFLVIGDYNMIPGLDDGTFLALSPGTGQNELLQYLSSSFAGQVSHIGSCPNGQPRGNLLDGFAISKNHTREYAQNSLKLISFSDTSVFAGADETAYTCATYEGLVSDHFPFVAKFKTDLADDD